MVLEELLWGLGAAGGSFDIQPPAAAQPPSGHRQDRSSPERPGDLGNRPGLASRSPASSRAHSLAFQASLAKGHGELCAFTWLTQLISCQPSPSPVSEGSQLGALLGSSLSCPGGGGIPEPLPGYPGLSGPCCEDRQLTLCSHSGLVLSFQLTSWREW